MSLIYGINPVLEALRGMPGSVEAVYAAADSRDMRGGRDDRDGRSGGRRGSSPLTEVLALCREGGVRVEMVSRKELEDLSHGGVHQGVAARLRAPDYADFADLAEEAKAAGPNGLLLLLDGIEDPHNLGALCRSASALGAQGVIIGKDRAAGITPAAVKASAGALPLFKVARVTNLTRTMNELKDMGFWSVAADMSGDRPPEAVDMTTPTLLVIGSEGKGIRRMLLEHCDFKVRIPMVGPISSLNASVAGAILLAEAARQRRSRGK